MQQLHWCPRSAVVAHGCGAYTAAPTAELSHTQGSSGSCLPVTEPGKHSWAGNLKDLRLLHQQLALMGNSLQIQKRELQRTYLASHRWSKILETACKTRAQEEHLRRLGNRKGIDSEWPPTAQPHPQPTSVFERQFIGLGHTWGEWVGRAQPGRAPAPQTPLCLSCCSSCLLQGPTASVHLPCSRMWI